MAEFDFDPEEAPAWPSVPEVTGRPEPGSEGEAAAEKIGAKPPVEKTEGWGRRELVLGALAMLASAALTLSLLVARGSPPAAAVQAAAEPPPPAVPVAPEVSAAPTWEAKRAWLGGHKGVAYEVAAESPIDVWMRTVRPTLVVRCIGKDPEVFVFTGTAAAIELNTQDHTVTLGFDGEAGESSLWPDSAEHDALFAPDGAALARRLRHTTTFSFGFTPHNAPPVTVRFRTAGLAELLQPLAKQCGWQ